VAAMNPTVTVTDAPSPEAFALIGDGLNKHNRDQLGYWDQRPLAVLVCDPHTGAVLGGLTGRTSLGLAFIDLVYLPAPPRSADAATAPASYKRPKPRHAAVAAAPACSTPSPSRRPSSTPAMAGRSSAASNATRRAPRACSSGRPSPQPLAWTAHDRQRPPAFTPPVVWRRPPAASSCPR